MLSRTSTLFGVGGAPAAQFRLEASGRGASDGQIVRKLAAVPPTAVTFMATAVASEGTPQFPFWPCTICTITPPGPIAVATGPTLSSPGLVSNKRQGGTGTSDDGAASLAPRTTGTTPTVIPPTAAATAIPIERLTDFLHRVVCIHDPW